MREVFSGIVSVIPWKDHFIQLILQFVVLIFHAENLIKRKTTDRMTHDLPSALLELKY